MRLMVVAEKQSMESLSEEFPLPEEKDRRMETSTDILNSSPVPETPSSKQFGQKELNRKNSLHEKVFPDESWSITSLPEGYECVDAMFMVEAEGICMLQQEIPVEVLSENLELPEMKSTKGTPCQEEEEEEEEENDDENDKVLPNEQEVLPQWSFPLETEEEKEMMEQKLVLEPRLLVSKFVSVSMEYLEDSEQETDEEEKEEEVEEDKEKKEIEREVESNICPDSPSICMQQLRIVEVGEKDKNNDANKRELECETCLSSSSTHIEQQQLRVIDAQVVCH